MKELQSEQIATNSKMNSFIVLRLIEFTKNFYLIDDVYSQIRRISFNASQDDRLASSFLPSVCEGSSNDDDSCSV